MKTGRFQKTKNVGRPKGNVLLRKLRIWYWYVNVKKRSETNGVPLTDYELSLMFSSDSSGERVNGADRIKLFESLRSNGSTPTRKFISKTPGAKLPINFIDFVDEHKDFRGTAEIFNTPFWQLLESKYYDSNTLRTLIVKCVENLRLEHDGDYDDDFVTDLEDTLENRPTMTALEYLNLRKSDVIDSGYDQALTFAFPGFRPSLDLVGFFLGLALENFNFSNFKKLKLHSEIAGHLLDSYFYQTGFDNVRISYARTANKKCHVNLAAEIINVFQSRIDYLMRQNPESHLLKFEDLLFGKVPPKSAIFAVLARHEKDCGRDNW